MVRISTLDRKLLRDLQSSGIILVAIASIIAVGVTCFVTMRSSYLNLGEAKADYYRRCRMADFSIDLEKAPLSEIAMIADLSGVSSIRSRINAFVTVDLPGVPQIVNGQVLSLPNRHTPLINDIVIKRGGYFTGRNEEEVILNDAFARRHQLSPGDLIYLILNDRREAFRVVGTAISSEFVYLLGPGSIVPDPEHFGVFYLPRQYMESAFGFEGACNQVLGLLDPSIRDQPKRLLDRAELSLSDFGVRSTTPRRDQVSNRFLSDEIDSLGKFAFVMPVIFLAVAALVLNILMARMTEQQRSTIGTLKAIGYSNRKLYIHFLKFGFVIGLVGGLAGCGLGYLLGGGLTRLYQTFFELPSLENRLYPGVFLSALLMSLIFSLFGTGRGARGVLELEPAEAMRPKPPEGGRVTWLERWPKLWSIMGTGWRLVLRNLLRNAQRNAIGCSAAAMASALVVMGFLGRSAIYEGIDFQFEKIQRSDVDLTLRDAHGLEALDETRRLPGVDYTEPVLEIACTFGNGPYEKRGGITGLQSMPLLTVPRDADGQRVPIPPSGLALGRGLAEQLRVQPGQTVIVEPVEGRQDPRRVRVSSIVDSFIGLAAYADILYLSRLVDEEFAVNRLQLRVDPSPGTMQRLQKELKQLPAIQAVSVRDDVVSNLMRTFVDSNAATTTIMVFFAGTIFFGTSLNASLISLAERRREVATLLVIGYRHSDVGRLFLRETIIINTLGTLIGLPLGQAMFQWLVESYQTDVFRIPLVKPWSAFGWTLFIGLTFIVIAHTFVARAIRKLDLQESMRVRE